ncbi:MAG TPA: radical SAM protein [bacterium]|nr:radical SAM protein [bacterium]
MGPEKKGAAPPEDALARIIFPKGVRVREVSSKSALTASKIPGMSYALNPYIGCSHACRYCYVRVMQRFFHHQGDVWGTFVDVKENAARLLMKELKRRKKGTVMLASATDCYQPLEKKLRLTRSCLELLSAARFPVSVLTKSALVMRDIDVFRQIDELSVGLTITTDDEAVRRVMEPRASSIPDRLGALRALHDAGLEPYVFVGPVLPMDAERLAGLLEPLASSVLFDRMNYPSLVRPLAMRHRWEMVLDLPWFEHVVSVFRRVFGDERVEAVCG